MNAPLRSFGLPAGMSRAMNAADWASSLKAGDLPFGTFLPYGNGRSYGDSCLNRRGTAIDTRGMNGIIRFDPATGVIEAEAGAMLSDIIAHAAPHGWFPAVVPGTQFVTLGGAIANDIHGKNHHRQGSFGSHVESFKLLRSDGSIRQCRPKSNAKLFSATIGGMGLTGLILSATIRLMHVPSLAIDQTAVPFDTLDEFFDLAPAYDESHAYVVAWIDQMARATRAGRGVLLAGNHAPDGGFETVPDKSRLSVPMPLPFNLLNAPFVKVFNAAYGWKQRRADTSRVDYRAFFFPLDGVRNWNRLYGPNGLYQHQSVIPEDTARTAIAALLETARDAGHASFLTVLKRFGASRSPGVMSFARPGYTLTLDFANRGASTRALLEQLDAITVEAGGAVNPYKDARMSAEVFDQSFARWREVEQQRDPAFLSDFWRRTAMALPQAKIARAA